VLVSAGAGEAAGPSRQLTEFQEDVWDVVQSPGCRKTALVLTKNMLRVAITTADGSQTLKVLAEGMSPRWLDEGRLLFLANPAGLQGNTIPQGYGDLYSIPVSGGQASKLAEHGAVAMFRISPDRRWVAYLTLERFENKGPSPASSLWVPGAMKRLHLIPASGGKARPLLETEQGPGVFAWPPDSKALAVAYEGKLAILPTGQGKPRILATGQKFDGGLEWSADAKYIVYTNWIPGPQPDVWMVSAAGGQPRNLTRDSQNYHEPSLSISPDARKLAFIKLEQKYRDDRLWILDLETGKPEPAGTDAYDPAWSPDGSRVAFWSHRDNQRDLYALDVHSGQIQRLTNTPDFERQPVWSPDGKSLAFTLARRQGGQLWLIDNP
jgi:Tol biopolymer transport system component